MCSWGSADATSISSRHVSSGDARVCGSVLLQRTWKEYYRLLAVVVVLAVVYVFVEMCVTVVVLVLASNCLFGAILCSLGVHQTCHY